jgi:hypothetical protein
MYFGPGNRENHIIASNAGDMLWRSEVSMYAGPGNRDNAINKRRWKADPGELQQLTHQSTHSPKPKHGEI